MAHSVLSKELVSCLQPGSLYILLYHHPNPTIKYHWGLYHHQAEEGGWKFDIINPGGMWQLAHPYGDGIAQTGLLDPDHDREPLGVVVRVGSAEDGDVEKVHGFIREDDERLNELNRELEGGISCRIYVMRACERLKVAGILGFEEWMDVQGEVLRLGEENRNLKDKEIMVVDLQGTGLERTTSA